MCCDSGTEHNYNNHNHTEERMTAEKKQEAVPAKGPTVPTPVSARKPWVKKSPVDVVREQVEKQRQHVAVLEQELTTAKRELQKLDQAQKVLESS
jgi:hypothetical protein